MACSCEQSNCQALDALIQNISSSSSIIWPTDAAYPVSRRLWNAVYDHRRPSFIVQVTSELDVAAVILYAHHAGKTVTAKGGGHSWAGFSTIDNGIVIDFCLMKRVQVDPKAQTATVEPGALLSDLDDATQVHGLAVPVGVISHTGVFGLVLGGGVGWLCRKYGASVDNILTVRMLLADGSQINVSKNENADLFWGVCGAAANFGIATSVTFKAHAIRRSYQGTIYYPLEQLKEVIYAINDYHRSAPREYNCELYNRSPNDDRHNLFLKVCYNFYMLEGTAEREAESVKNIGKPIKAVWAWVTHLENQKQFDNESPHHRRYYAESGSMKVEDIREPFIHAFQRSIHDITSPYCMVEMIGLGGAMRDFPPDHTAFLPLRAQDWLINVVAQWDIEDSVTTDTGKATMDKKHKDWCKQSFLQLETRAPGYTNMFTEISITKQERAFGPNLTRLRQLKTRYDPTNFWKHNFNILPLANLSATEKEHGITDGSSS